jgi:hypothetical protein
MDIFPKREDKNLSENEIEFHEKDSAPKVWPFFH